tara:strand:+ start:670 stop:855 length:186 start_codon:yes stop_codon:yes gene_type:complete
MVLRKIAKIQSRIGMANASIGKIPSISPLPLKLANKVRQPAKYPRVRLPQSPKKIEAGLLL